MKTSLEKTLIFGFAFWYGGFAATPAEVLNNWSADEWGYLAGSSVGNAIFWMLILYPACGWITRKIKGKNRPRVTVGISTNSTKN